MSRVFAFLKDESGATAIEYSLIAAGISIVIIASVNAVGSSLNTKLTPFRPSSSKLLREAGFLEAVSAGRLAFLVLERTGNTSGGERV
jgi:pilus assembly protein Flp/PilA